MILPTTVHIRIEFGAARRTCHLLSTEAPDLSRFNLMTTLRAGRVQRRHHFLKVDFVAGGHEAIFALYAARNHLGRIRGDRSDESSR